MVRSIVTGVRSFQASERPELVNSGRIFSDLSRGVVLRESLRHKNGGKTILHVCIIKTYNDQVSS